MDMSSLLGVLLSSDSVSGVSKATKADNNEVASVLNAALPMLLKGAKKQSEDKDTAESFATALLSHGKKDTSNLSSFLKNVDLDDGSKIIGHLLGKDDDSVKKIAKSSGVSTKKTGDILSAAAPLLMSLLGQESASKKSDSNVALELAGALLKNVDVGDLIGDLLGGDNKKKKSSKKKDNDAGEIIGDILGALLK
ncbi:MAG: DUF937 domain-containing protein [Oscillospiraceae bacterium]|nr:DUF937 domain-containing protein [Oscillospiraceae bacterium]